MSRTIITLGSMAFCAASLGVAASVQRDGRAASVSDAPAASPKSVLVRPAIASEAAVTVIPEIVITPHFVLLPEILVEGRLVRPKIRVDAPAPRREVATL